MLVATDASARGFGGGGHMGGFGGHLVASAHKVMGATIACKIALTCTSVH